MKKLCLFATAVILSSCANKPKTTLTESIIHQFINRSNQIEQCLFPELWVEKDLSVDDSYCSASVYRGDLRDLGFAGKTVITAMELEFLQLLIGTQNFEALTLDELEAQVNKFNHNNVFPYNQDWCRRTKISYQQALVTQFDAVLFPQTEKQKKAYKVFLALPEGQAYLAQRELSEQDQIAQQNLIRQKVKDKHELLQTQYEKRKKLQEKNKMPECYGLGLHYACVTNWQM